MFATNKVEGSQGPWMTWTSNGSAEKGFQPRTWIERGKDINDVSYQKMVDGFNNPCVFDVDSLKLGWERDTAQGPERRYSSHYSQPMPRPSEEKDAQGRFVWKNCLSVRVAVSQDHAVTWEQGAWGAYDAFVALSKQIEAQWDQSQNGKLLPVVQMTDVRTEAMKGGNSHVPVLTIQKWIERPAVLTDAAPSIATNAAPAPAPATEPAPTPAPAPQTQAAPVSTAAGF